MKKFKKIMALALAGVMTLSMSMAVFATEPDISDTNGTFTYTELKHDSTSSSLKVNNIGETEHTFQLYQIFVGDVVPVDPATDPATATLANITWGTGVTAAGKTALGDATTKAKTLTGASAAKAFADALVESKYLTNPNEKIAAKGATAEWTGLNPGYYLVIDKVDTQDGSDTLKDSAYTAYIMQVVGTVTRNAKLDIPSVEKKVQDTNDSKDATATANADDYDANGKIWKDSADYDVNDVIPYKITGTLPANFAEYETYKTYTFTDTLSNGLTPPAESGVKVTLDTLTGTDITSLFDVDVTGQVIKVSLKEASDLRTNTNPTFTMNSKIIVSYSATLNDQAVIGADGNDNTVDLEYSNNPNKGGEGDKGKTPEDKNIVFTYTVNVNKVTGSDALPGAAFALYKKYVGTLPTGKTAATEIKYDNGKETYTIPTGEQWVLVEQKTASSTTTQFGFDRVDDGEYLLVETTTPAGYNSVKPMQFKVEAAHVAENANPTLTSVTGTDAKADGSTTLDSINLGELTVSGKLSGVTTDVNNESGTVLPSTGGIGTTIFYILGAILVLGAGIVLVTRRRMSAN